MKRLLLVTLVLAFLVSDALLAQQTLKFELSNKKLPDFVGIYFPGLIVDSPAIDLNNDGFDDVLYGGPGWFEVAEEEVPIIALINDGNLGFASNLSGVLDESQEVPELFHVREINTEDFNGDGLLDVVLANHGIDLEPFVGERNALLLSQPNGKYVDSKIGDPLFDYEGFTHSQTTGDIDNDGDIDIVFSDLGGADVPGCDNLIKVLINDGSANFTLHEDWIPSEYRLCGATISWTSCKLADLNGDKFPELILGQIDSQSQDLIFWNNGTGDFSQVGPFPTTLLPGVDEYEIVPEIETADLNDDGLIDLLVSRTKNEPFYEGRYIQALINNGDGSFTDRSEFYFPNLNRNGNWILKIVLVDINNDGKKDFLPQFGTPLLGDEQQFLFLKQDTGEYRSIDPTLLPKTGGLVPIDADNDGDLDLLVYSIENFQQPNQIFSWHLLINNTPSVLFSDSFESAE